MAETDQDVAVASSRLTPEAVRAKVFGTVRLREGYDMAEVDAFLSEVETTIAALMKDRSRLASRPQVPAPPSPAVDAAKIMLLAQETADRLLERAERQAENIVLEARSRAEAIERELSGRRAAVERAAQDQERLERVSAFLRGGAGQTPGGLHEQLSQLQHLIDELTSPKDLIPAQATQPWPPGQPGL